MSIIPKLLRPDKGDPGCDATSIVIMSVSNIQESFFHAAREGNKHVTVHLLNGVRLSGRIRSFDKHSVVLETTTLEQLVFKHSISAAFICVNKHCPECHPEAPAVTQHASTRE